jgi:hypothetical protein
MPQPKPSEGAGPPEHLLRPARGGPLAKSTRRRLRLLLPLPGAAGSLAPLGVGPGPGLRVDVLAGTEFLRHRVKGRNLRALCLALKTWEENPWEILARLWFSGSPEQISRQAAAAQRLLEAGFGEMAHWLHDQGGEEIKEFLGERSKAFE